ncbi:MAG: L,D-transpeptidase family protein [Pyrinomonadaceae bacterium]
MFTTTISFRILLLAGLFIVFSSTSLFANRQRGMLLEAEKRLAALGYWVTKADGRADASTRHAVMAFQKIEGLKRTGVLTRPVLEKIKNASTPIARHGGPAHIEIDISRQVLLMVNDEGAVTLVVPVSTGNGERYYAKDRAEWDIARTPRGKYKIFNKFNGTRKAPLGDLFYPSYFLAGWAVHGSNSVPAKPASHGCVRVPRGADQMLFKIMPKGMPIYLYD